MVEVSKKGRSGLGFPLNKVSNVKQGESDGDIDL